MKCGACNYYHLEDFQIEMEDDAFQEDLRKNNGEVEFSRMVVTAEVEDTSYSFSSMEVTKVSLYVCLRCGTVRSESYGIKYGL